MYRDDFSEGWTPDVAENDRHSRGLTRADNLVFDGKRVKLRSGSQQVYSLSGNVHDLHTGYIGTSRYRFAAVDDKVYVNGGLLFSGGSTEKTAFVDAFSKIFIASGRIKYKYDGVSAKPWGLEMTGAAPTIVSTSNPRQYVVTSFSGNESPGWTASEGTVSLIDDRYGRPNGSLKLIPDPDTGRCVASQVWSYRRSFTQYSTGESILPTDSFQLWLYLPEPDLIYELTIEIDVNTADFQNDRYTYRWGEGEPTQIEVDPNRLREQIIDRVASQIPPQYRNYYLDQIERSINIRPQIQAPAFSAQPGWNLLKIPFSSLDRIGNTEGKGWNTVRGMRVMARMKTGDGVYVGLDDCSIVGGEDRGLKGTYRYRYTYVDEQGDYVAYSAPSAESASVTVEGRDVTIEIPADPSRPSNATKAYIYRFGGFLLGYMKVGEVALSGTAAAQFTDSISDLDAIIVDEELDIDALPPPDNIEGIAGPYFDRIFCLTSDGKLWPSKIHNPETFTSGQVVNVGFNEKAYWIVKAFGGLYIGTNRDIYRLEGTGAEFPDGTVDWTLRPLNVTNPPINDCVAFEDDMLIYMAQDGWRLLRGDATENISSRLAPLFRGETRYSVSPLNIETGRFRAVFSKGIFSAIACEGASTTGSQVLYRYDSVKRVWMRHSYQLTWASLTREADGTVLAGATTGQVYQLDVGSDDNGTAISFVLHTTKDDDGKQNRKDPAVARVYAQATSANVYLRPETSDIFIGSLAGSEGDYQFDLTGVVGKFVRVKWAILGNGPTFELMSLGVDYKDLPPKITYFESAPAQRSGNRKRFAGVVLAIDTFGNNVTVTPYVDGTALSPITVNTTDSGVRTYEFPVTVGFDSWVKISGSSGFELYEVHPHIIEEFPPIAKGMIFTSNFGIKAEKEMTGFDIRVCTLGETVTFTPYLDGVARTDLNFQITTGPDEPVFEQIQFTSPVIFEDLGLYTDKPVELYR